MTSFKVVIYLHFQELRVSDSIFCSIAFCASDSIFFPPNSSVLIRDRKGGVFLNRGVHTCAHAQCELNSFLLYSSLNVCSTVSSMDRTMMIRWSGLDCAHVLWKGSEYSSISCLVTSWTCHSFYGIRAIDIAVVFTCQHILGSGRECGSFLTDRLQGKSFGPIPALRGRGERRPTDWTTSIRWTGRGVRWRAGLD